MKTRIFLAVAALSLLAACTKTEIGGPSQEITFQVASHQAMTRANTDYKDTYSGVPFGAYAWFKGDDPADNNTFMVNQQVAYDSAGNRWAPAGTTYYWPKSGALDFICYSPYTADGTAAPAPVITETTINYPLWNVNANRSVDVMYADKVSGLTGNSNTYYYNGVPTLFHHALARVSFQIKAAYLQKTASTGDITRWEITVNSIQLHGIRTTGTLALTLNTDGTWKKPASNVWTNDGSNSTFDLNVSGLTNLTTSLQDLDANVMVLPQALNEGQGVTLNVTIKTYRDQNDGNGEKLILTETAIDVPALLSSTALSAWGINQNITYKFILTPSTSSGSSEDPTTILFDPAVAGWEQVTVNTEIKL
jgi:hypothetical protein